MLSACGGVGSSSPPVLGGWPEELPALHHRQIHHVVVIVQENRSVDNLFAGIPGRAHAAYGYNRSGVKDHAEARSARGGVGFPARFHELLRLLRRPGRVPGDGLQNGRLRQRDWECGKAGYPQCPNANPPYSYVPRSETKPYFFIGEHYIFADEMFPSNFDSSSFVSHQYAIAAQASSTVNFPIGPWGCEGGSTIPTVTQQRTIGKSVAPCFNNKTLGDELDKAGVSWRYYTSEVDAGGGAWSAYQAIEHIYKGPDWSKDVITPQTRFFKDVSKGDLPAVSWITPTCVNSDHAGCHSNSGPDWVASLVNPIGESKYWDSTAIFIFWDDYGGWYDHVAPGMVDYDGLGIRVPLLVVSAYAKPDAYRTCGTNTAASSSSSRISGDFARLSASDMRANPIAANCFDYSREPGSLRRYLRTQEHRTFSGSRSTPRPPDTE